MLRKLALGRVDQAFGVVLRLGRLTALFVFLGKLLGILHHLLDVGIAETARSLYLDLLFLARALVLGMDRNDAVRVDIERDFDLRHPARRGWNADQIELAKQLVVRRHFALALENPDRNGLLIVVRRRIDLALLGRDRRVAVDHARENATQRLDTKRKRRHVKQEDILDVALKHARLNGSAHCHDFIGVHAGVRLLAEKVLHDFADPRHAGHAADQNDFADIGRLDACIGQRLLAGVERALDQSFDHLFEVGARDRLDEVLWPGRVRRDERQVHFCRRCRRQLDLRLFGSFLQPLQSKLVLRQVDAFGLLEFGCQELDDRRVEIFTAKEGVAIGRLNFEHAIADLKDRDVERAATKIIDRDQLAFALFKAIGERRCRRLVDDAEHFEARNLACVLGRLALRVVEIGRNGDDGLSHGFAEIAFGGFLHLLEREGRNLRRRIIFAACLHPRIAGLALDDRIGDETHVLLRHRIVETAADKALHRENRILGIGDGLALGRLTDQALAILGEGHDRRRCPRAFHIFNHLGLATFHHCDAAVGGSQIDPDHFCHFNPSFTLSRLGSRPPLRRGRTHGSEGDIGVDLLVARFRRD